jgi:hypothetical protein
MFYSFKKLNNIPTNYLWMEQGNKNSFRLNLNVVHTFFFSRTCGRSVYLCIKRKRCYSQPITVATISPQQLRLQQAALSCVDLYCHALTLKEKN